MIPIVLIQLWIAMHSPMQPRIVWTIEPIANQSVLVSASAKHRITEGFICFSDHDIKCVDDICDDGKLHWSIRLNGEYATVNSQTVLKESDKLRLEYSNLKERYGK